MRNTKIPGHCLFTRLGGASRAAWVALAILAGLHQAAAQGTAFTYQGRLDNGTNPANGSYDLTFALYNASTGDTLVARPPTNLDAHASNGRLTVTEIIGAVLDRQACSLRIGVRANGGHPCRCPHSPSGIDTCAVCGHGFRVRHASPFAVSGHSGLTQ